MTTEPLRKPTCRLCACLLTDTRDDQALRLCWSCLDRPEARRLGANPKPRPVPVAPARPAAPAPPLVACPPRPIRPPAAAAGPARNFTPADRALIKAMHGYLPALELLRLLNERLHADLGPDAGAYTLDQLHTEIGDVTAPEDAAQDWAGLRRALQRARLSGLLTQVTPQLLEDFAIVFQLAPAQLVHLKDVVHHAQEPA
jgi:hypothetical protein